MPDGSYRTTSPDGAGKEQSCFSWCPHGHHSLRGRAQMGTTHFEDVPKWAPLTSKTCPNGHHSLQRRAQMGTTHFKDVPKWAPLDWAITALDEGFSKRGSTQRAHQGTKKPRHAATNCHGSRQQPPSRAKVEERQFVKDRCNARSDVTGAQLGTSHVFAAKGGFRHARTRGRTGGGCLQFNQPNPPLC